ncbi:MAG: hypothetical protein VX614_01530 [Myxococcota bacterium]|nr:hypothetical protein [Myxococcota bacterium]
MKCVVRGRIHRRSGGEHHAPVRAAETRGGERDTLDRQVGAQFVDRRELGLDVGPEFLLALGHCDARVGIRRCAFARRDRVERLVGHWCAERGIERKQFVQDRGAGSRRPSHDHGRRDRLVFDAGVGFERSAE